MTCWRSHTAVASDTVHANNAPHWWRSTAWLNARAEVVTSELVVSARLRAAAWQAAARSMCRTCAKDHLHHSRLGDPARACLHAAGGHKHSPTPLSRCAAAHLSAIACKSIGSGRRMSVSGWRSCEAAGAVSSDEHSQYGRCAPPPGLSMSIKSNTKLVLCGLHVGTGGLWSGAAPADGHHQAGLLLSATCHAVHSNLRGLQRFQHVS